MCNKKSPDSSTKIHISSSKSRSIRMQKLAFYIAKDIKRQCETYDFALFRKENSEQAAKQRLHKFYFEQKHIQNHNDTLHHKTAIMLTPHATEPDRR